LNIGDNILQWTVVNGNCRDSASIIIIRRDSIDCLGKIKIPTAFSPNSDGYNDKFLVKGLEDYPDNELVIYNRWGVVVFNKKEYRNDWDGTGDNGEPLPEAKALLINEVEEGKDYALVMSTCSGAWRYIIGDTIRFTSAKKAEIIITGRTKHFLSLVGEHLSVDNMNHAVEKLSAAHGVEIPEFMVCGLNENNTFSHQWYLGVKGGNLDKEAAAKFLDAKLCELNDDYAVERKSALKNIFVEFIHPDRFYEFMQQKGKMGGQNKFPRVMKQSQHEEWKIFLQAK
jgi:gliding motility-associated-like protein